MVLGAGIAMKTDMRYPRRARCKNVSSTIFSDNILLPLSCRKLWVCFWLSDTTNICKISHILFNLLQGCLYFIRTTTWRKSHIGRFWCNMVPFQGQIQFLYFALVKGKRTHVLVTKALVMWNDRPVTLWWLNVISPQLMMFMRRGMIFPMARYKDVWPVTLTPSLGNCLWFV